MGRFSFRTDAEAEQYCREILDILTGHYRLSPSEALHLLNTGWKVLSELRTQKHTGETQQILKGCCLSLGGCL
jgi:hypothetical protein